MGKKVNAEATLMDEVMLPSGVVVSLKDIDFKTARELRPLLIRLKAKGIKIAKHLFEEAMQGKEPDPFEAMAVGLELLDAYGVDMAVKLAQRLGVPKAEELTDEDLAILLLTLFFRTLASISK